MGGVRNPTKEQHQRPEGKLVEARIALNKLTIPKLAKRLGMSSPDWLRHMVNGYRTSGGQVHPVAFDADKLALVARELYISQDALREAGRADAAERLILMSDRGNSPAKPAPSEAAIKEVLAYLSGQQDHDRRAAQG